MFTIVAYPSICMNLVLFLCCISHRLVSMGYPGLFSTSHIGKLISPILTVSKHNILPFHLFVVQCKLHSLGFMVLTMKWPLDNSFMPQSCASFLYLPTYCRVGDISNIPAMLLRGIPSWLLCIFYLISNGFPLLSGKLCRSTRSCFDCQGSLDIELFEPSSYGNQGNFQLLAYRSQGHIALEFSNCKLSNFPTILRHIDWISSGLGNVLF